MACRLGVRLRDRMRGCRWGHPAIWIIVWVLADERHRSFAGSLFLGCFRFLWAWQFCVHPGGLSQLGFNFFHGRQGRLEFRRQDAGEFVFGNANRFAHAAQSILGDYLVAILTQYQANGRRIGLVAELVIDDAQIEVHLAGVFRLEFSCLQIDHDEAADLQVVEQQVVIEIAVADFPVELPADKGEALPLFQQEAFDVAKEIRFELAFVEGLFKGQEIEDVRILECLAGQVGLRSRKALVEIGKSLSLPAMNLGLDHGEQDRAAPAVGQCLLHVPEAGL